MYNNNSTSSGGKFDQTMVRFLHASPNNICADIFVNNALLIKDLSYKKVSKYFSLSDFECNVDIISKSSENVVRKTIFLQQGKTYLFAVTEMDLLTFEINAAVPLGESKMRFLHLAAETPSLDFAVKDRDVVFPKITFQRITDYLGLTPMTVDLELRIAGSKEIILPLNKLQFKANQTYTLALLGSPVIGLHLLILSENDLIP
jgi:hypothetical protein